MNFTLTDNEKSILLQTARLTITSRLTGKKADYPEPTPKLKEKCGAFVTLHKSGKLRGCIGYVEDIKPLFETVKEVSESSAFGDPRFPSVRPDELDSIDIEISVLTPLKRIKSIDEIQVGVHGIMIKQGYYSGLLLPQVATEYGWDRETFLAHTCSKAGLPGKCWRESNTEIEIFSAIIFGEKKDNYE